MDCGTCFSLDVPSYSAPPVYFHHLHTVQPNSMNVGADQVLCHGRKPNKYGKLTIIVIVVLMPIVWGVINADDINLA